LRPRPSRLLALTWLLLLALPLSARAEHAYVSNEDGRSVSVIDTESGQVVATIEVGKRPRGLKLSPDGSRLYVAVSGLPKCPPSVPDAECAKLKRDLAADGIAVVDTAQRKLVKVLHAGTDPEQFDVDRSGRRLYVANEDAGTLSVVDIPGDKVVTRISVGREPEGVRISPDQDWVIVTSETDSTLSLISTHMLQLMRTIPVGHRPRDLAYSPDGKTVYVGGEVDASVYRVSLPSGTPTMQLLQLRREDRPMGVLLDPARKRLYVSTGRGGSVAVISLEERSLIAEPDVGARPWGMALTPDMRFLYTANGSSNDVSVIDLGDLQVKRKIPVGRSPWGVVIGR
jgi:YVTN family beta-propeller protein